MTREEAIKEWIIPALKNTWNEKKNAEILKALEQEPSGDAISRQEVLDEINRIGVKAFETYDDYSELFDFVDGLPSVSTEKTGHWIRVHHIDGNKNTTMNKCSNCFQEFGWDIETGISFEDYNFCPNCGAKMVEVGDKD